MSFAAIPKRRWKSVRGLPEGPCHAGGCVAGGPPLPCRFASRAVLLAAISAGVFAVAEPACAAQRAFTFTYEAHTSPKGEWEYEQWVTWKTSKRKDRDFDRLEFRHEIEYGITDDWQAALYFAEWRYQDGKSVEKDGAEFRNVSVETIYRFTDPTADPVGVAAYLEFKGGPDLLELESKLILQKNFGRWTIAWNGVLEAEWEGKRYAEDNGKLKQTLGVSYQFNPGFRAGIEAFHEIEREDWAKWGEHAVYVGPAVSYRTRKWFVTVTPAAQVTGIGGEPDFVTRVLFGISF